MKKLVLLTLILLSGCIYYTNDKPKDRLIETPQQNISFLQDNVIIKRQEESYIIYKYKNARVDEVAPLAAQYCHQKNLKAYLREVILDKENYRLATFDCLVIND